MASEARLQFGLSIRKDNYVYSRSETFQADVSAAKAASPGQVEVTTTGVDIDLGALLVPSLAVVKNLSSTATVEIGVHDGSVFHPFLELLPGEAFPIRLSRNIGEEHTALGTATTGTVNTVHAKAYGGTANIYFEAHDL